MKLSDLRKVTSTTRNKIILSLYSIYVALTFMFIGSFTSAKINGFKVDNIVCVYILIRILIVIIVGVKYINPIFKRKEIEYKINLCDHEVVDNFGSLEDTSICIHCGLSINSKDIIIKYRTLSRTEENVKLALDAHTKRIFDR